MLLDSDTLIKVANQRLLNINNQLRGRRINKELKTCLESAKIETLAWKKAFKELGMEVDKKILPKTATLKLHVVE